MKVPFYYEGHYKTVAERIKSHINSMPHFLSQYTADSPRAVGDAIEKLISDSFDSFLGEWCTEYSSDFARRAMADLAFNDRDGFYTVVDVKTHREDTKFNMPNLTSVERLARFYQSDSNVFAILMVKYRINDSELEATDVIFSPIEFLDWECLTIGALGWGQIQIANSNFLSINHGFSRRNWMIQLCDTVLDFYPSEILKIKGRVSHFEEIKRRWVGRQDLWTA